MNGNTEFLNYIYQNAEMGRDTIKQLIEISKDEEYKKMLECQLEEYKEIHNIAEKKIEELNKEAKEISSFSKISAYIMINMKTLMDKTPSHISEMLIQGSNMGIIEITKKINEYPNADKDIIDLANRLLKFEQNNLEKYKKYL